LAVLAARDGRVAAAYAHLEAADRAGVYPQNDVRSLSMRFLVDWALDRPSAADHLRAARARAAELEMGARSAGRLWLDHAELVRAAAAERAPGPSPASALAFAPARPEAD
jgi:hypothetical protein